MKSSRRSADVRKQARANLLRIRQERLRRRAPSQSEAVAVDPVQEELESAIEEALTADDDPLAEMPGATGEDGSFDEEDVFADAAEGADSVEDLGLEDVTAEFEQEEAGLEGGDPSETDEPSQVLSEPSADLAAEPADEFGESALASEEADADLSPVDTEEVKEAAETPPNDDLAAEQTQPIEEHSKIPSSDTDLASLPGAGPGLIWMLWNASIHSLDDLAKADAAELSAALGPVGKILDIEQLVALAAETASSAAEPGN